MPATLTFVETLRYNFPYATAGNGTALTVCKRLGDPALAFLTQTSFDDDIVYLCLSEDFEYTRHPSPPGRETISGMAYNRFDHNIWCGSGTNNADVIFSFDPDDGTEQSFIDVSADETLNGDTRGFATNGLFLLRAAGFQLELRTMGGFKLAQKEYPGRSFRGASASPFSWTMVDGVNDEIVILDPFGNEIATAPAPGAPNGCEAIAFDNVTDVSNDPQIWVGCGLIGAPGTPNHPDTPWNPAPWSFRHRLYIANNVDQVIYCGYLTE